jgi:hypothetical protein
MLRAKIVQDLIDALAVDRVIQPVAGGVDARALGRVEHGGDHVDGTARSGQRHAGGLDRWRCAGDGIRDRHRGVTAPRCKDGTGAEVVRQRGRSSLLNIVALNY